MAVGATGTPTVNFSLPTYATGADAPSGQGFNSAMAFIDALLLGAPFASKISGLAAGMVPVWNGTTWVKPTGTPDGTKFLRDDGSWAASGGGTPTGVVLPYGGATAPSSDWLLADGTAVSRTTYAALFALFSTTYGTGDGSTTFNVPDLRGRVPVGKGTHADVTTLGANDGVAVANRRAKHRHSPHSHGHNAKTNGGDQNVGGGGGGIIVAGSSSGATINSADGGSGNANDPLDAPAYLVLNYIIKT